MPGDAIYVGCPSKWGNPIKLEGDCIFIDAGYRRKILDPWVFHSVGDINDVMYLYRSLWDSCQSNDVDLRYWQEQFRKLDLTELRGKDLACWCPLSQPCHADILIDILNKTHET